MSFLSLLIGILAVWRVTHLLAIEAGPWDMLVRFRRRMAGNTVGSLFACFYCLSLWTAAAIAYMFGQPAKQWVLLWLSFSGGAILLERITLRAAETPPAAYSEDGNDQDERGVNGPGGYTYPANEMTFKQEQEEENVLRQN